MLYVKLLLGINSGESLILLVISIFISFSQSKCEEPLDLLKLNVSSFANVFEEVDDYIPPPRFYSNPEPELIVIDNLYIKNPLYGTEVIIDPYKDELESVEDEESF